MVHSPHEPNSTAILHDGCDRCTNHAVSLTSLDDINLYRLWDKMLAVEIEGTPDYYESVTEAHACRSLHKTYLLMERLGLTVSPNMAAV